MAADSGKWFVIVNPVAGSGRGLDHFPQISKHLRDAHILCEPVFTEHKFREDRFAEDVGIAQVLSLIHI